MILFVASDDDDRDSERRPKEEHLGGKAALKLGIIIVVVFLGIYAIFFPGCKAKRDWLVTKNNMYEIYRAIQLYAGENDDGLPVAYEFADPSDPNRPTMEDDGNPICWALQIVRYIDREKLNNPSTPADSDTLLTIFGVEDYQRLGYGLVSGLSGRRNYEIADRSATVLFAESMGGQPDWNDPLPLTGSKRNGFVIGYDNSNVEPNLQSNFATRIAFPDKGRLHPDHGTAAMNNDGSLRILQFSGRNIQRLGQNRVGPWIPYPVY